MKWIGANKKHIIFVIVLIVVLCALYSTFNVVSFGVTSGTHKEMGIVNLLQEESPDKHLWFNKESEDLSEVYSLWHKILAKVTFFLGYDTPQEIHNFYMFFPFFLIPISVILIYILCFRLFNNAILAFASTLAYFFLFDMWSLATYHIGRHFALFILCPLLFIFFFKYLDKNKPFNIHWILVGALIVVLAKTHLLYALYPTIFILGYCVLKLIIDFSLKRKEKSKTLVASISIMAISILAILYGSIFTLTTKTHIAPYYSDLSLWTTNFLSFPVLKPSLLFNLFGYLYLVYFLIIFLCAIVLLRDLVRKRISYDKDKVKLVTIIFVAFVSPIVILFSPLSQTFFKILSPGVVAEQLILQPMILFISLPFAIFYLLKRFFDLKPVSKYKIKSKIPILVLIILVILIIPQLYYMTKISVFEDNMNEEMYFGQDTLNYLNGIDRKIILSDPITSNMIPTVSSNKVALPLKSFLFRLTMEENKQIDTLSLLYGQEAPKETVSSLINKYDVDTILICEEFDKPLPKKTAERINMFPYNTSIFEKNINELGLKKTVLEKCVVFEI